MEIVLLALDFLCPTFFFLLGRTRRGRTRRVLVRESLLTFLLALLFAPIGFLFFSLSVQGIICAGILLSQFLFLTKEMILTEKK